jgi:hypothetical protein
MIMASMAQGQAPAPTPALPISGVAPLSPKEPVDTPEMAKDKAEIMELANKLEAATAHGDVDAAASLISPDFTMIHGNGWTYGANVLAADDRQAYLNRVKNHEYPVHDIDPSSIHFEMHGDVAIVWGRYLSLFMPQGRPNGALTSIWFERVYQKQNGKWIYLSHRSVRVAPSPAGIDPGAVTTMTFFVQTNGFNRGGSYQFEGNGTGDGHNLPLSARMGTRAERAGTGASASVSGMQSGTSGRSGGVPAPSAKGPDIDEVFAMERKLGDAVSGGDTNFFANFASDDFSMTHGDIWTRGGINPLVDTKESFANRITVKQYNAFIEDPRTQGAELHGNVMITWGRYVASIKGFPAAQAWFSCWYERVYEKRNGKWVYLSHRTVHNPMRGPTRESVQDK